MALPRSSTCSQGSLDQRTTFLSSPVAFTPSGCEWILLPAWSDRSLMSVLRETDYVGHVSFDAAQDLVTAAPGTRRGPLDVPGHQRSGMVLHNPFRPLSPAALLSTDPGNRLQEGCVIWIQPREKISGSEQDALQVSAG